MNLSSVLNGALWQKQGQVMILAYSRIDAGDGSIGDAAKGSLDAIDHAEFEWQMEQVVRRFAPLPLSRLMGHLGGKRALSGPQVCVSFHSDERSSCLAATPILRRLKIPATWFLAFDKVLGNSAGGSVGDLDWAAISELCASGDDLAHRIDDSMASVESAKRRSHLRALRSRVENEARVRVHSFAYAGNGFGESLRPLIYDAALAGFNLGVSGGVGVNPLRPISPMMLNRTAVARDMTRTRFEALLDALGPGS
jgi:peptidoglycan/xylan/chitin deacetylase (PgdA/CDA1 family)